MLNFSLRFLGQSTKLLFRVGMALGGVLLFSIFRLITAYLTAGPSEIETETGEFSEAMRQAEDDTAGTLPSNNMFF